MSSVVFGHTHGVKMLLQYMVQILPKLQFKLYCIVSNGRLAYPLILQVEQHILAQFKVI